MNLFNKKININKNNIIMNKIYYKKQKQLKKNNQQINKYFEIYLP